MDEVKETQNENNSDNYDDMEHKETFDKERKENTECPITTGKNSNSENNEECELGGIEQERERIETWEYNRNRQNNTYTNDNNTHETNKRVKKASEENTIHSHEFDEFGKVYHFNNEIGKDEADVVYLNSALFQNVNATQVGLRSTDAHRIHLLDKCITAHHGCTLSNTHLNKHNTTVNLSISELHSVLFTPRIACYRIDGDAIANEYVLFDAHTNTLACTDLFYGDYGDLDLLNS